MATIISRTKAIPGRRKRKQDKMAEHAKRMKALKAMIKERTP